VLAIRAEIPVPLLKDTIAQFPSFSEGLGIALRSLPDLPEGECMMDHAPHPAIDLEQVGVA
jgi:hypothetical protein